MSDTEQRLTNVFALLSLIALATAVVCAITALFVDGETALKWALLSIAWGVIAKVLNE